MSRENPYQIDPREYNTGIPEVDNIPYEEKYKTTSDDLIQTYGGIIKDLTDTEGLLKNYELKLQGKVLNTRTNKIEEIDGLSIKIQRGKAIEFVDMLRSIVNQNTHFSNFNEAIIYNLLASANYSINRWLMFQGTSIPLRYRPKISFEAMNMIIASLFKSNNGTILDWTKGTFDEREHSNGGRREDKGNIFMPWTWGKKNN